MRVFQNPSNITSNIIELNVFDFQNINTLRKPLQTTSVLSYPTQVQPASRFLVRSLIFIEYNNYNKQMFIALNIKWRRQGLSSPDIIFSLTYLN